MAVEMLNDRGEDRNSEKKFLYLNKLHAMKGIGEGRHSSTQS
jgi:hypothetical protein